MTAETTPTITTITFERNASSFGIGQSRPHLSWRFGQTSTTEKNWTQKYYEIRLDRDGKISIYKKTGSENIDVEWPGEALRSRESVKIGVRAAGEWEVWTGWYETTVEAGLLDEGDWKAAFIAPSIAPISNITKRPFILRQTFQFKQREDKPIRLYATALGVYHVKLNDQTIGDHVLAPGWQSYHHRLHYQIYDIPSSILKSGENVIEATVGEGWYSGRLTWKEDCRNIWGSEPSVSLQLEVGGEVVVKTDESWKWSYGPIISSELYDGEVYDDNIKPEIWGSTKVISLPSTTKVIAPEAPPIRRIQEIKPTKLITTPKGKIILDFGQNLVGWIKIRNIPKRSSGEIEAVVLSFVEVLDNGEIGKRPLRSAKATDKIFLGHHEVDTWEPSFTSHGFRYCQVTAPQSMLKDWKENFTAIVVHSDMERLGDFNCSHELINQLHRNVIWSLRGNFVGLPTDCPQRDERLGWTGDLQAFAPTASFLYDTSGMLANWLHDLKEEQLKDYGNIVPLVIPNIPSAFTEWPPKAQSVWGDVCVITPKDLYTAYGSKLVLEEMFVSITAWLDKGIPRGEDGLWDNPRNGFQFADWLDPNAPPGDAAAAMTDQYLVADAYLVGVTQIASKIATIIGKSSEAKRYGADHTRLRKAFQHNYIAPSGRISSDTQTAYCLAYHFNLLDPSHLPGASERLLRLARKGHYKISTGFAGTPHILQALVSAGHLQLAYRMLEEKGCPSWLYPVTMGATTIWERWDSLLPDGSINPGEMTSFNHYAFGAVARFFYTTIAGLSPLEPGYKKILINPRPGGSITHAKAYTVTPFGKASVAWRLEKGKLVVDFEIPPNASAVVRIGRGKEESVGSGVYQRIVDYEPEVVWPPE